MVAVAVLNLQVVLVDQHQAVLDKLVQHLKVAVVRSLVEAVVVDTMVVVAVVVQQVKVSKPLVVVDQVILTQKLRHLYLHKQIMVLSQMHQVHIEMVQEISHPHLTNPERMEELLLV